jgi:diguanylate cyclase (GGDEF)-like protein/PAS domain S-box-containing protein
VLNSALERIHFMPKVLIISAADLRNELGRTVLWRSGIERSFAVDTEAAAEAARALTPSLIVVDGGRQDALAMVRKLREDPSTRPTAIAVVSRDPDLADADTFRSAGATVVMPADANPVVWDGRLEELLQVPQRREARIPVRLETWSRLAADGDVVEGSALNISVNGLLFESPRPLHVGSKLDLRFRLPGRDDELQAVGEVVRQDDRPRSGIKFLVLKGDARQAIRAFVESGIAAASALATPTLERSEWEAALKASETLKAAILESAPDPVIIMNHEGRVVEINQAAERVLGYPHDKIVGRTVAETFAPPSATDPHRRLLGHYLATGGGPLVDRRVEMTARRADGQEIPIELAVNATPLNGKAFFTAYLRDISEPKRVERLKAALYRIADTAATAEDMPGFYEAIHRVIAELMYARNFYIALRDDAADDVQFPYFVDEVDAQPPNGAHKKTLTNYVLKTGEPLLASPTLFADLVSRGEVEMVGSASVDWIGVPLKSQNRAFGVLAVQSYDPAIRYTDADRDVLTFVSHQIASALERKAAEERIEHLAFHDALTGLPNRRLLLDRLDLALAQARRDNKHMAVLFLDLDAFKVINDTLGHIAGDQVLRETAVRLQNHLRKGDTLARVGGDEFTAVIRGIVHPVDTAKVAQSFQNALRDPILADGRELFVTACTGISVFPDDGQDVESLLKNADTALHRAKEQGQDTFRLYAASMNAEAVRRLRLEHSLRRALERDELAVHYQPIVDLLTGAIQGVEALIRWNHPEHGLVLPGEFIPLAERTGLLSTIGAWVLRAACRQARQWGEAGHRELSVAVNISARQLQYTDLVGEVQTALKESGLEAYRLELEITESSAMRNPEATIQTLRALKALGVRISIDDFGTGYSSLSQLQRLPIDTLKIDRSFVHDITTDPDDAAIATAVIALAHTLKLKVVAEGVETKEQLSFLADKGCDRIQGYLLSRPLAPEACAALLASHPVETWRPKP